MDSPATTAHPSVSRLARRVLVAFLLTFVTARIFVLMIMLRWVPDFYLFAGGTHVHHLNYGIFLLCITGAITLFYQLTPRHRNWAAIAYGIGLGLTFDEFGMWLHLGGSYWQGASYDAVVVVSGLLSLVAVAPALSRFRTLHWTMLLLLLISLGLLIWLAVTVSRYAGDELSPDLHRIERAGPVE